MGHSDFRTAKLSRQVAQHTDLLRTCLNIVEYSATRSLVQKVWWSFLCWMKAVSEAASSNQESHQASSCPNKTGISSISALNPTKAVCFGHHVKQ